MKQHLANSDEVAAGLRALPATAGSFAAAQAAWRFYTNPRISLPQLAEPIIEQARQAVANECQEYVLAVHDWSGLSYSHHESKKDRIVLYSEKQLGYELQAVLALSDGTGRPLAPLYQGVRAADGIHSTRRESPLPVRAHLDEVGLTMRHVEGVGLDKPMVHVIDCEADSVLHLRRWHRKKYAFVVRADNVRRVLFDGRDVRLEEVLSKLQDQFHFSREVEFKGQGAQQYVAETEVTLHRYAKLHRVRNGRRVRKYVRGRPLTLRLVVSEIRDEAGQVVARWLLWTNLADVPADTVALWYYWRWRVESYFKLLKSAGQHVEQWQQETAQAVAKQLLVAAQAGVVVWALARSNEPEAEPARALLVRLSGRLMKRGKPFTEPALLAGMWVLLAMLNALDRYSVAQIRQMAAFILPSPVGRDTS
ncbi:MAG: hypothetical protein HY314_10785 [Acidobacteria bacterium]|nr:hypothetical protein [Acidobacteriota bacterium]